MSERMRRALRFLIGGVANTLLSYSLYLLLRQAVGYQWAWLGAYAGGIVFGYWFSATQVFRVALSWRALLSYPLVYLAQYLVSALLLHLLVERLGAGSAWAPLPVALLMLPLTYCLSGLLLVRRKRLGHGA